ncbi:MAG: D-aminoacyl-tRNA deacylase [Ilumatobacter sp.]|nr:D-tyrosyl-tRNA(Tyr) deacylase [bacterium]MDG1266464.1 D-aminoacyl-tRNA deacylase [Ilumatobacter sp.]MDG2040179.1 D-aminoacyl-tRNA deacylase [Ilumatobacter sp.]NKB41669.1 D-tyrosyl-tRNA(Tyr) deacylase [Ilumatobacter sp.]
MRAVVQRVVSAEVTSRAVGESEARRVGHIGPGMCVFVGVTHSDNAKSAQKLAAKLFGLRIFNDADGVMNLGAQEVGGEFLVVSQFTLYGDTRRGRRPSWTAAAQPEHAEPLVDHVVDELRSLGVIVQTGRFRTEMVVDLVNDGPVTLVIDV